MKYSPLPSDYVSNHKQYVDERYFLETLMNARFNFMWVAFALSLTGVMSTKQLFLQIFILSVGCLVCLVLAIATYRAFTVVSPIIDLLKNPPAAQTQDAPAPGDTTQPQTPVETPLGWASKMAKEFHKFSWGANHLIGAVVPAVCVIALFITLCLVTFGEWKIGDAPSALSHCDAAALTDYWDKSFNELFKLDELRKRSLLTDAEFRKEKQRLLEVNSTLCGAP